ncbi:MAG: EAL domain-containing protein [Betaproteobacteria bacterium]|nr:EAL domain-containing protein [Betaproteobacteria bacterium]
MDRPIAILLLEDSAEDAELVMRALRKANIDAAVQRVSSEAEMERVLASAPPELILSDYNMPEFGGGRALQIARTRCPEVPFIFVSGTIGEERAIEALHDGAVDYVLKDNLARLGPAVLRAVQEAAEHERRGKAERALEAAEKRFRLFMQHLPAAVLMKDLEGRITFANPSFERIVGKPAIEFLGRSSHEVFPKGYADGFVAHDQSAIATNDVFAAVEQVPIADTVHSFLTHRFPIPDESGRLAMVGVVATDITERIRQEAKLARLSRIHALLSGINAMIVRARTQGEVFREACRIAVASGGFHAAWIGLTDPDQPKLKVVAARDAELGFRDEAALMHSSVSDDDVIAESALRDRKPVVIEDVATDPRVLRTRGNRGCRSSAALPLIIGEEAIGVLVLHAKEAGFFDDNELGLLKELANDVSFALDHLAKEEKLAYVVCYDTLTGLANRALFIDRLTQLIRASGTRPQPLATLVFELQRVGLINDSLGRSAGDALLRAFAGRLQDIFGRSATLARITDDRFAVAMQDLQSATIVSWIEHWNAHGLAAPFDIDGQELHPAWTIGIAAYPGDGDTAETLLSNAEAAVQRARVAGESYAFYSAEVGVRVAHRLNLEGRLRQAAARDQFILHYQPKVDLRTRRLLGLEALIRWHDPDRGMVPPIEFIEVLEATGLIVDVGRWVIEQAMRDVHQWRSRGLAVPRVAVNVSQVQIRKQEFVATVLAASGAGQGGNVSLDIEITESLTMEDTKATIDKLRALRTNGLQICMDDFGTGYSSLSSIASLPLDAVKIDRAFIARMSEGHQAFAIVSTIVKLAQTLRLRAIAEGVETEQQARVLAELGCDEAQGYLFGKPMPRDDIGKLLKSVTVPLRAVNSP